MVINDTFERRDSGKRRRLSERRRAFSRLSGRASQMHKLLSSGSASDRNWSNSSQIGPDPDQPPGSSNRSESPLGDRNGKVSMKIQFHIRVAPDNEPLILDPHTWSPNHLGPSVAISSPNSTDSGTKKRQSIESVDSSIHERLTRQNTLSTKRRQQLLAMHNQSIKSGSSAKGNMTNGEVKMEDKIQGSIQSEDNIIAMAEYENRKSNENSSAVSSDKKKDDPIVKDKQDLPILGRAEQGVRSSTITSGMSDEATMRFLARHNKPQIESPLIYNLSARGSIIPVDSEREHIYFKRDGQRFGHEFTLKLAVDRTYRCLLKVRPNMHLQAISIQGHHITFVDCTSGRGQDGSRPGNGSLMRSAPSLSRSWQNINSSKQNLHDQPCKDNHLRSKYEQNSNNNYQGVHNNHRLNHAKTLANVSRAGTSSGLATSASPSHLGANLNPSSYHISQGGSLTIDHTTMRHLREQQQSQMLRSFAASHSSSSSNSHLGSQLIYMFDWSASHFEVNKNKVRTQVQTVLKFKNGQVITLPLQVKFYQSESRQHLNWGSQLHFIDFDCGTDNFGNMNVDRVQYY